MNMMTDVPKPMPGFNRPDTDTYNARDLIKDGAQATIVLDQQIYVLRITRAGKLILTK